MNYLQRTMLVSPPLLVMGRGWFIFIIGADPPKLRFNITDAFKVKNET